LILRTVAGSRRGIGVRFDVVEQRGAAQGRPGGVASRRTACLAAGSPGWATAGRAIPGCSRALQGIAAARLGAAGRRALQAQLDQQLPALAGCAQFAEGGFGGPPSRSPGFAPGERRIARSFTRGGGCAEASRRRWGRASSAGVQGSGERSCSRSSGATWPVPPGMVQEPLERRAASRPEGQPSSGAPGEAVALAGQGLAGRHGSSSAAAGGAHS